MTHETNVQPVPPAGRDAALQIITLGFITDPVARWIWPELELYLTMMPKFAAAFGGGAFARGSADITGSGRAAALWLPPGDEPDGDTIADLFAESVRPEIAQDLGAMFAQMDAFHPVDAPCWYLPMIAADPGFVGTGLGSALLRHGLQRCDAAGQAAYLESSNPRNVSLYERHDFEVIGEIQSGGSPSMFAMVRMPRGLG